MAYSPIFNYPNNKLYQYEAYPVELTCSFKVTPTNGLGITELKGSGIANVFMHTSTTPTANNGLTNPNPAGGIILLQLQNNFSKLLSLESSIQAPTTGTLTATAANVTYVITALGTATTAQWVAKGLPVGVTPAVGQAFVATATGTIGGSATVQAPSVSGVGSIEIVGDPNAMLQNVNVYQNGGGQIILKCLGASGTVTMNSYTPAGTNSAPAFTGSALGTHTHSIPPGTDGGGGTSGATSAGTPAGTVAAPTFTGSPAVLTGSITEAQALTAPATGSVIRLRLKLSNSSVVVNGQ